MDIDPVVWRAREGVDPPHHGIGRGFKVAKEEIAGLVAALEDFVQRDHEADARELVEWLQELSALLAPRPSRVVRGPGFYPRLIVEAPAEARAWAERLASVSPAIVVPHHGLDRGELVVRAEAIDVGDREHVVRSLAATAP
jgi:L-seryl-tRNA(Ser) seleniumtransferase